MVIHAACEFEIYKYSERISLAASELAITMIRYERDIGDDPLLSRDLKERQEYLKAISEKALAIKVLAEKLQRPRVN